MILLTCFFSNSFLVFHDNYELNMNYLNSQNVFTKRQFGKHTKDKYPK